MRKPAALLAALLLITPHVAAQWSATPQPDLQAQLEQAPKLKIENMCEPVKATTVANFWLIPNPHESGYDALQWYYKGYKGPTSVAICELRKKTVAVQEFRTGKQINAAGTTTDRKGRVWITSPGGNTGVHVFIYDPVKNTLTQTDLHVPQLGDAQRLTVGTDGLIYGAGSDSKAGKVGLFTIDPETMKLTDLGPVGPPATYAMGLCADATHIYFVARRGEWHLVAYDKATRQTEILQSTTTAGAVFVYQKEFGCHSQGRGYKALSAGPHHFWLHKGKVIEHADHATDWPWKEPKRPAKRPSPEPEIDKDALTPGPDGKAMFRYRYKGGKWLEAPFEVPLYPVETHRLIALPDGRMAGKAGFYHGEFLFDPKTGEGTHVSRSGVSYNAGTVVGPDGKVYSCGYSSSLLMVLDPNRPMNPIKGNVAADKMPIDPKYNPRLLASLRKFTGTHTMTDAAVGADGKVYFCGNSYRDTNRGGLGWWDIEKDEGGGVWEPFSNVAISYMTPVAGGKYLVMSTFPKKDTELGKPTPEEGKLMVWDVAAAKVVRDIVPIPGGQWTGMILGLDDRRVLGLTMNPKDAKTYFLYGVDITTGAVAFRKLVPNPEVQIRPHSHQGKYRFDLFPGPDGMVYTFMQHKLVRINPESAHVDVIGHIGAPGDMAFHGRDLYMAGQTAIRRIRNVALPNTQKKD